jgi:hypothetical protein
MVDNGLKGNGGAIGASKAGKMKLVFHSKSPCMIIREGEEKLSRKPT